MRARQNRAGVGLAIIVQQAPELQHALAERMTVRPAHVDDRDQPADHDPLGRSPPSGPRSL